MTSDAAPISTRLQAELRRRVPNAVYEVWLEPLTCAGLEDDRLIVVAPTEVHAWVHQRFGDVLTAAAREVLGDEGAVVELRAEEPSSAPGSRPPTVAPKADAVPAAEVASRLNPKFTFEQFVIGDANRFAHAAALAVAELPAQAYNPLFIVGPPGVGKTHLLHSIGNYVRAYGGGLTVRYATVESFTNDFLAALQARNVERFKRRYRHNDVLLIDDVQFLESKVKTEEEFFHTFNALHEMGSQLVLTSDRPPSDMAALQDRLRQRFEAGLLVEIQVPDTATRLAVLRKRAHHDAIETCEEGVLELIAERVTTSVRGLEAALIRVVAYASLTGEPVSRALAGRVLDELYGPLVIARASRSPTVESIQRLVAEAFALSPQELVSPNRTARVAWPRQLAMYLAREHTHETLPAIGASFGGRDHSTVVHACKRAAERLRTDPEAFAVVRDLTARIIPIGAGGTSSRGTM